MDMGINKAKKPRSVLQPKKGEKMCKFRDLAVRENIISHIKAGVPQKHAAHAAGIAESTFYKWMEKDYDFFQNVRRAEAECIARNSAIINKAASDDWRAAAWYLERRAGAEYGKREQIELKGSISVDLSAPVKKKIKKYEPKGLSDTSVIRTVGRGFEQLGDE